MEVTISGKAEAVRSCNKISISSIFRGINNRSWIAIDSLGHALHPWPANESRVTNFKA